MLYCPSSSLGSVIVSERHLVARSWNDIGDVTSCSETFGILRFFFVLFFYVSGATTSAIFIIKLYLYKSQTYCEIYNRPKKIIIKKNSLISIACLKMAVTGVTVAVELLKKKQKEKKLFSLPPPLIQQRGSILFRFWSLQSLSTACLPPLKKKENIIKPT